METLKPSSYLQLQEIPEVHNQERLVIFLDGMSCAGKTTTLQILSQEPGVTTLPEVLTPIPIRHRSVKAGDALTDLYRSQYWFYRQHLQKDALLNDVSGQILVDRGILGLFAYAALYDPVITCKLLQAAKARTWNSGHYLFFIADPACIKDRIAGRSDYQGNLETEWQTGMEEFFTTHYQAVTSLAQALQAPLIDTTHLTKAQMIAAVTDEITKITHRNLD